MITDNLCYVCWMLPLILTYPCASIDLTQISIKIVKMGNCKSGNSTEDRHNYSSTLSLCLLASLGVCFAFLPDLPLNKKAVSERDVIFIVARASVSAILLAVEIQLIRYIRLKKRFHQGQVVFWPMRCRHCARALGVLQESTRENVAGQPDGDTCQTSAEYPQGAPSSSVDENEQTNFPQTSHFLPTTSSPGVSPIPGCAASAVPGRRASPLAHNGIPGTSVVGRQVQSREIDGNREIASPLHHDGIFLRRHRSLVNVFNVLAVLAIITVPVLATGKFMLICNCDHEDIGKLIPGEIMDICFIILLPVAMVFIIQYYDAVFVTNAENCYSIVIFLSGGIWVWAMKLVMPIGSLLGTDELQPACKLNGTFGEILHYGELAMRPFYMECAIIATGILWQMWTSFVSKSVINLNREMPHYDAFPKNNASSSVLSFKSCCGFYINRITNARRESNTVQQSLLQQEQPQGLQQHVFKTWLLCLLACLAYFGINLYLIILSWSNVSVGRVTYVAWSLEITICLPVFILLMHLSYISRHNTSPEGGNPPCLPTRLEGHDVMLLLCTCGIFCQCFIRLTAVIGLLASASYKNNDEFAILIFGLVYSIVIVVYIWYSTSFLLRIQRRNLMSPLEIKWVLATLVFIATSNATEWLIDTIIVQEWPVQGRYFGKTAGRAIGVLLDPFTTLYGLHAAMVAYEAYKVVLRKALQQGRSLNNL